MKLSDELIILPLIPKHFLVFKVCVYAKKSQKNKITPVFKLFKMKNHFLLTTKKMTTAPIRVNAQITIPNSGIVGGTSFPQKVTWLIPCFPFVIVPLIPPL